MDDGNSSSSPSSSLSSSSSFSDDDNDSDLHTVETTTATTTTNQTKRPRPSCKPKTPDSQYKKTIKDNRILEYIVFKPDTDFPSPHPVYIVKHPVTQRWTFDLSGLSQNIFAREYIRDHLEWKEALQYAREMRNFSVKVVTRSDESHAETLARSRKTLMNSD